MLRCPILLAAASVLTACAASTGSGSPPRLDPVDLVLTRPCERPVPLPNRDLTDREVVRLWGTDRKHLVDCGHRHRAHVQAIETRDGLISGRLPLPPSKRSSP